MQITHTHTHILYFLSFLFYDLKIEANLLQGRKPDPMKTLLPIQVSLCTIFLILLNAENSLGLWEKTDHTILPGEKNYHDGSDTFFILPMSSLLTVSIFFKCKQIMD